MPRVDVSCKGSGRGREGPRTRARDCREDARVSGDAGEMVVQEDVAPRTTGGASEGPSGVLTGRSERPYSCAAHLVDGSPGGGLKRGYRGRRLLGRASSGETGGCEGSN